MIPNDRILIIKILILWNHQIQTYLIHVPFIIYLNMNLTHYLVAVLYSRLNKSVMLTLLPKNLALIRRLVKTDKILILELARQIVLQNQCASPDIFLEYEKTIHHSMSISKLFQSTNNLTSQYLPIHTVLLQI